MYDVDIINNDINTLTIQSNGFKCKVCFENIMVQKPIMFCNFCLGIFQHRPSFIFKHNSIICLLCQSKLNLCKKSDTCKCLSISYEFDEKYLFPKYNDVENMSCRSKLVCYGWNRCFDKNPTVSICKSCVIFLENSEIEVIKTRIQCTNCKFIVLDGFDIHDEHSCSCGQVSVDGFGTHALYMYKNNSDFTNLSQVKIKLSPNCLIPNYFNYKTIA